MKQLLRLITPTKEVLNDIMVLANRQSRWSVPVVMHSFPVKMELPAGKSSSLYTIPVSTDKKRPKISMIRVETVAHHPSTTLPQLRLIRGAPVRSSWAALPVVVDNSTIPEPPKILRPIRSMRRKTKTTLHAFPVDDHRPKKSITGLRRIRRAIADL